MKKEKLFRILILSMIGIMAASITNSFAASAFADGNTMPAMGDVNNPSNGLIVSGNVQVRGWFLDGSGVSKIDILVDGEVDGTAATEIARPDVLNAYPAYANGNSGYQYVLDTTKLTNGSHNIVIRETSKTNVQTRLPSRTIIVLN